MKYNTFYSDLIMVAFAGLSLRAIVSLHSYSGENSPPLYGDYEAQRHWQEITVNLPIKDWYRNVTDNDLLYWGLDYPPLTAYHSYMIGQYGHYINKSFVALHESRGYQSKAHKTFMRSTVMLADILIYLPGVLILSLTIQNVFRTKVALPCFMVFMLYPGQILIDNGHFQYNNISLGLAAAAIAFILIDNLYVGSFLFSLALNYKQMELYHALPFFFYILRHCFLQKSWIQGFRKLFGVAAVVIITFGVIWLPWIYRIESVLSVIGRLFPFNRGVFEDKVANFWCAINVLYKLKNKIPYQSMIYVCLAVTALVILPINTNLYLRAVKSRFLFALTNTALAFYLFSYQVHEKSILLVSLPAISLLGFIPQEVVLFLEVSSFSLLPLLSKDNLLIPYIALTVIFHILSTNWLANYKKKSTTRADIKIFQQISNVIAIGIFSASILIPPPLKYPFLWPLLNALYSCGHFLCFLIYCCWCQLQ